MREPPSLFLGFEKSSVVNWFFVYVNFFCKLVLNLPISASLPPRLDDMLPSRSIYLNSSSGIWTFTLGKSCAIFYGSYISFMSYRKSSTFSTERAYPMAVVLVIGLNIEALLSLTATTLSIRASILPVSWALIALIAWKSVFFLSSKRF